MRRQVADWRAALAYSRLLHDGDSRRIAIWGSSFGGGHVIRVAAREPVAAAIAMCPFTSGPASAKALGALTSAKLLPGALRDAATARTRRGAHGVALFGPPRAAALMNSPDAEPGMRALIPEGVDFDERIDGRIALHLPYQLPGRHTRRIPAPILFVVCDHDTLTPAETTVKYAERAPRGEIKRYPAGHFDVFQGPVFERMVADQVDFLTRHLG